MSPGALAKLSRHRRLSFIGAFSYSRPGRDVSVAWFYASHYLPALAGLVHGPGFANLSCLGRLSDLFDDFPKLSSGKADRKALTSILTVRMTKETEEVITAHGH
jgi:hypothetical protein